MFNTSKRVLNNQKVLRQFLEFIKIRLIPFLTDDLQEIQRHGLTKGMHYQFGKEQEAIVCYDKALEINPSDAMAWNNKGIVLSNLGKEQEAIACYDKALNFSPIYETWNYKGIALARLGKYQEAIACYDKALEINPRYKDAWHYKGLIEDKLHKRQAAITSYKQFLELASKDDTEAIAYASKRLEELEGE